MRLEEIDAESVQTEFQQSINNFHLSNFRISEKLFDIRRRPGRSFFPVLREGWHPGWVSGCYAIVHNPRAEPLGLSL